MVVDARERRRPDRMHAVKRAIVVPAIVLLLAGCASGPPAPTRSSPPPATTRSTPSSPPGAGAPASAASQGRFINTTSWSLRVWIDASPANSAAPPTVTLQPGETVPWTLAQGPRRIVAHAYPVGQAGGEVVGRFDRTIALDPQRASGWFLRFREADFR
jgi:hypothetical protein